ncbi:MAG: RNA-directed DNA polymerase [Candidatus Izemoplasmatales bacterium]
MLALFIIQEDSFHNKSKEEISRYVYGSYNKFKYMIYYNASYLIYKKRIVEFENDGKKERKIQALIDFIYGDLSDENYIDYLLDRIDYYPVIKKETIINGSKHIALNYFIDIPVELHIIDVMWTIIKGLSFKNDEMEKFWYGNLLNKKQLYKQNAHTLNDILWETNFLFNKYIKDYNKWISESLKCIKNQCNINDDLTLVSSDLKRFYYSTNSPFREFPSTTYNSIIEPYLSALTVVIEKMYQKYHSMIASISKIDMGECILPIGLTSSMLIANAYLSDFDDSISKLDDVIFYGRYVDDMIIIFKKEVKLEEAKKLLKSLLEENQYNVSINEEKTAVFSYHNYNFLSTEERFINYIKTKSNSYVGNEDLEEVSFERYFEFEKKYLNNNLISNSQLSEDMFVKIDVHDAIIFMNYIYDLIDFSHEVREVIYNKITTFINTTTKFTMWKEIYRWVNSFQIQNDSVLEIEKLLQERFKNMIENNIEEINAVFSDNVHKKLMSTYEEINEISKILARVEENTPYARAFELSGMCRKDSIIKHLVINYRENKKLFNNSTEYYKDYYGNYLPFIHLWEVVLFDQLVNLSKKNHKSYQESVRTFTELNHINEFDNIYFAKSIEMDNLNGDVIVIGDQQKMNSFVVSHPNINLDSDEFIPLSKHHVIPSTTDTRLFIRNLLDSFENNTSTLVLPELYVKLEWLPIVARIAHHKEFNVSMGVENLVLGRRFYNVMISLYSFRDSFSHRNLFPIVREKNFYSYIEQEWCDQPSVKLICRNPSTPKYYLVKNKGISFVDYLCFEITDIFSRALFKGMADVTILPMLNRDTTYFDNIIQSLSRDLSCCVITSNSATWGNSSIILPRSSHEKVLTDFKGGFNNYLVSSLLPVYELINFNNSFYWKNKNIPFKKHPANYNHISIDSHEKEDYKLDWE